MSSNKKEKARRLFDSYAANLSHYLPAYAHTFVCPLCLRSFPRSALEKKEVSLEHLIPSKIGGRFETLTCRDCNCGDGSRLDANFINRLRTEDKFTGVSDEALRVRIRVSEGEARGRVYLSGDHISIHVIPEISNPELLETMFQELASGATGFSIHGSLGYKGRNAAAGLLRMGYLMAFSYFGYGYIFHENLNQVREQIAHPETPTDVLRGLIQINDIAVTNVMGLLNEPAQLRCFLAVLEMETSAKRVFGVVLPGLSADGKDIYSRWNAAAPETVSGLRALDLITFDPSYVSDPMHKYLPSRIWDGKVRIGAPPADDTGSAAPQQALQPDSRTLS